MKTNYKKVLTSLAITTALIGTASAYAASFKDVTSNHWAYSAVEWGVTKEIAKGYADGSFKPSSPVTTEEFLSMLVRSYEGALAASGGRWSDPYYAIATSNNYPTGSNRNAKITRTAVAEIIAGTQGKNFSGNNAIKYMLANGLAGGKTANTVAGYKGGDTLSRAEALVFIKNVLDKTGGADLQVRPTTPSDTKELPDEQVPLGNIKVVGDTDAKLAALANEVQAVVSPLGFTSGYNKSQNRVGIWTADGMAFMTYSDGAQVEGGTQVITLDGMLSADNGDKIKVGRLEATLAAMGALGLPNNGKVAASLKTAIEAVGGDPLTVEVGGVVLELLDVGYGKVVIYVD